MSQTAEQVIDSIQHLPPGEQARLWEWLKDNQPTAENLVSDDEKREREIFQRLLAKGLLTEIAPGLTDEEDDEIQPVKIVGEPLSETIIRERR